MNKLDWIVYSNGYFETADGNTYLARRHRRTGTVQTEFRDGWREANAPGQFVPDPWWVLATTVMTWLIIVVPPIACLLQRQWGYALYSGTMSVFLFRRCL